MPDFDAVLVGGTPQIWSDQESAAPEAASRLSPDVDHPPTYRAFESTVEVNMVVSGVQAPLDAALGGRLFEYAWVEWSGDAMLPIVSPAGQSSVATIEPGFENAGHFILRVRREGGGAILIPFDVEFPT